MKTAICYFSGTGNSLDIPQKMAPALDAEVLYIPATDPKELKGYARIVLVSPIYLFGLPTPTKRFIEGLAPGAAYHVVLHYGGFAGNAAHYARQYLARQGIEVEGVYKLTMPENFTFVANVPEWHIKKNLAKTAKRVERIVNSINQGEKRVPSKNIFGFLDKLHNKNAVKWETLPESYIISDDCTSCGYCAEICPTNTIQVTPGQKPVFSAGCASCLACFHRCPHQAINYGTKTVGKPRYVNPNVDFALMQRRGE